MKQAPGHFVSPNFSEYITDILYSVKFKGKKEAGYVYLACEHRSTPDTVMPLRMTQYICQICEQHIKQHSTKKLPLIYPFVLYHGRRTPYPAPLEFKDCFADPDFTEKYTLQGFHLIDLNQIKDEELREHQEAAIMELIFKHILMRDILPTLQFINKANLLAQIAEVLGDQHLVYTMKYLLVASNTEDKEKLFDEFTKPLPKAYKEALMAIAEELRQEGLELGIKQGIEQVAHSLLQAGQPIDLIAKTTGLAEKKIANFQA